MAELPNFDKLWNFSDPAASEQRFQELFASAESGGNQAYLASLLTQIARAQGLQGEAQQAIATLDRADGLIEEGMSEARVRYLLERGRAINGLPRPYSDDDERAGKAKPWFLQAWEYGQAHGEDFYAVDAAHMLAIVSAPDEALAWQEKALMLAERSTQERTRNWLGSLYNNLGWSYFEQGDYREALDRFEMALAFREARAQAPQIRIARWSVAKTQRMLGDIEVALETQRALLQEYQELGETDGYVFEEIAECLLLRDGEAAAAPWFTRAYQALSQDDWFMQNYAERAERMRRLGQAGA